MKQHKGTKPRRLCPVRFGGTAVYVENVPAALDFYRRAFGFKTRFFDEALQYGELECSSSVVAFGSHQLGRMLMPGRYRRRGRPSGVELAFLTMDVPAAFAQAVAAGAVPLAAPKKMAWGLIVAYLRCPHGVIIGLSEPPPGTVALG